MIEQNIMRKIDQKETKKLCRVSKNLNNLAVD